MEWNRQVWSEQQKDQPTSHNQWFLASIDKCCCALKSALSTLQELQAQYPSNILAAYNWDYLSSWRRLVEATSAQKDYDDLLADIVPFKDWEDGRL